MQNAVPDTKPMDSGRLLQLQVLADRQMDSMKSLAHKDSQVSFVAQVTSDLKESNSFASLLVAERKNEDSHSAKPEEHTNALRGPSALFSQTCTIAVGKTMPVTILWANDSAAIPKRLQLVTIKTDDLANDKAKFTIEDQSGVLLFSQTGYAVNDKIRIEDERHDMNVSVLEVHSDFAVIKIVSHLNEDIISRLQKAE